jgi:hypothetical protein
MTSVHIALGPDVEYNDNDYSLYADAEVLGVFAELPDALACRASYVDLLAGQWDPSDLGLSDGDEMMEALRECSRVRTFDVTESDRQPLRDELAPWIVDGRPTVWMVQVMDENTHILGVFVDPRDAAACIAERTSAARLRIAADPDASRWDEPPELRAIAVAVHEAGDAVVAGSR